MKYLLIIAMLMFSASICLQTEEYVYAPGTDKGATITTKVIKPLLFTNVQEVNPSQFPYVVKGHKRDLEPDRLFLTFKGEKEAGREVYMSFTFAPYPVKGVKLEGSWTFTEDWKDDTDLDDLQNKNWLPQTGTLRWEVADPATMFFTLRLEVIDATATNVTTGLATFPVTVSGKYQGL